jgi:hypothetical protein
LAIIMALCSNADPKKNSANLVVSLFVVGIVYQFIVHDFRKELAMDAVQQPSIDDANGLEGECMETKLFKMWHAEAEAETLLFRDVETRNRTLVTAGQISQPQEVVQIDDAAASAPRGLRGSRRINSTENEFEKQLAAHEKKVQEAKARRAEFDRLYEEAEKAIHERSSPVPKWLEIQAQLQSQYDNLPSTRARLARERRQEFDKIVEETQALLDAKKDAVTPWAQNLMDSQAQMQSKLDHLHDGHRQSLKSAGTQPNATSDAKLGAAASLEQLFAETESLLHAEKNTVSPWAQRLMDSQAEMQSRLEHLHDGHKSPSKLRGARAVVKTDGIGGDKKRGLQWVPVKSWKENAPHRNGVVDNTSAMKAVPVSREQLRHAKWEGKIPNVSCIMALPSNASAQVHFKYAVNNFKLQHYEGGVELIVVYHHGDKAASRLVQTYAEEGRIRGVASRANGEFPSTMALRYGAWTSKADVIAQWDFEAWHHPDRLSMQVRAMAMSGRPGSLVKDPEPRAVVTEAVRVNVMEGSLIGEAAWMREHWHPLLDEERGLVGVYQSHNIALVDAPALAIDRQHTPAMNTSPTSSSSSGSSSSSFSTMDGHDALESLGIEACRSLLGRNASTDTRDDLDMTRIFEGGSLGFDHADQGIVRHVVPNGQGARLGVVQGMQVLWIEGKAYSYDLLNEFAAGTRPYTVIFNTGNSKRLRATGVLWKSMQNVSEKLEVLCKEADDKVDPKERSFMHHHAGTMETLRRELGTHFDFGGSNP